eukprot:PhM_4_TR8456/c0_g3_i1/m.1248
MIPAATQIYKNSTDVIKRSCSILTNHADFQQMHDAVIALERALTVHDHDFCSLVDVAVAADAPTLLVHAMTALDPETKDSNGGLDVVMIRSALRTLSKIAKRNSSVVATTNVVDVLLTMICSSAQSRLDVDVLIEVISYLRVFRNTLPCKSLEHILPVMVDFYDDDSHSANKLLGTHRRLCAIYTSLIEQCLSYYDSCPGTEVFRKALSVVVEILSTYLQTYSTESTDSHVVSVIKDAIVAISHVCDCGGTGLVLESGVFPTIVSLLEHRIVPSSGHLSTIQRNHDYVQRGAHLSNGDCVRHVLHYVPAGPKFNDIVFLCKDWFFDVVCHDSVLVSRARDAHMYPAEIILTALSVFSCVAAHEADAVACIPVGSLAYFDGLLYHADAKVREQT